MIAFFMALLGIGGKTLEQYNDRVAKREEQAGRIEEAETVAKVARLQKSADAEIAWDQSAVDQMQHSWKDEWFTILLSIPAILAFTGGWGASVVLAGFAALEEMPDWYVQAFLLAIAASFGWRKLVDVINRVTKK